MKVFACKRQGSYSGGLIIVAANSVEEAYLTAAKSPLGYFLHFYDDNWNYISDPDNANQVKSDDYPLSHWFEITSLAANVDTPQVIEENSYAE